MDTGIWIVCVVEPPDANVTTHGQEPVDELTISVRSHPTWTLPPVVLVWMVTERLDPPVVGNATNVVGITCPTRRVEIALARFADTEGATVRARRRAR